MAKPESLKPQVKVSETPETNYAKFTITGLPRGFAQTLGNSLRRVLLSSIPGVAFSAVEIDGALHEFTALDGVYEDVTQIILNLKKVVLVIDNDKLFKVNSKPVKEELYVFELDHKGKGEIKAKDLKHSSEIRIINPEEHIATVSDGGHLKCFLFARRGIGYVGANDNKIFCEDIGGNIITGRIAIDSIFTPVTRCRYDCLKENNLNGQETDKLVLEVWTNGSIKPTDALSLASKFLDDHFAVLKEAVNEDMQNIFTFQKGTPKVDKRLEIELETLDFSLRTSNCFKAAELVTVGDLLKYSEEDLKKLRNLGDISISEIKEKLSNMKLSLASDKK